ncbi:metallophosphoesterase [Pseudactinotalea sp. HY160]|uniref:metallophosphoesterase family protein n=1 Tax=Pseudactinotalea sp. HY160 TaxID=2654490 RepID=UPI00128BB5F7|nr:metallophosphoesterase family protein [Pseudactinotalea sp. HY160]MPV50076.1 metallophosphoesterase [Pseudactinotalea sp. HY160]
MSTTYFTSDTHFGHRLVADLRSYDTVLGLRLFDTVDEYDEYVVAVWNEVVRPRDTVWHLGDVTLGNINRVGHLLSRLHGTIHLVTGNHDEVAPGVSRRAPRLQRTWLQYFDSIQPYARIRAAGHHVLLSHYPYTGEGKRVGADRYTQYRLPNEGMPLIHGHTHDSGQRLSFDEGTPMVHVGWDAWGKPVRLDKVIATFGWEG